MKNVKKWLSAVCSIAMVMSLAACGAKNDGTADKADNTDGEKKKFKVAYASLCEDNDFGISSKDSFVKEAEAMGWELVVLNNNYDGATAIQNMDTVLTQECDGFVNFQVDAGVAQTISDMAKEADLPMITVDCPHPGMPFFGANNKEAGLIVGKALGEKAVKNWEGKADLVVLCGAPGSGEVVDLRMQGIATGIKEVLKNENIEVLELDGKSEIETSQKVIADVLTANPDKKNILIGCLNDQSALGAFNAVEAAGRESDVYIASHGCDAPAIDNLKNNEENCWIGSVAYFPERYGEYLVPLMNDMLNGKEVPEESFPEHVFVDKTNIDQYY